MAFPIEKFRPRRRHLLKLIASQTSLSLAGIGLFGGCTENTPPPWTGAVFPSFSLPAPDNTLHHSREYLGHPLLINFWATWCPPCRSEMADLNTLHNRLGPLGLQILAISVDSDRNLVREYLRKESLGFVILIDDNQKWSSAALRVPGFPTTYLVGTDGLINNAWIGPRAWADPGIQNEIATRTGLMQ